MLIAHSSPLKSWITNVQLWKGYIRELGWLANAAYGLLCVAAVMVGIPRLTLCAVAGLLFGFGEGLAISLVGSVLGSYGAFMLARKWCGTLIRERVGRLSWLKPLLQRPTWLQVFWVRQLMLPGIVLNAMYGLSDILHHTFLLGTFMGYLPLNVAFCLVGSGLGKDSLTKTMVQLLAALAVVNLFGSMAWSIKMRKSKLGPK